MNDMNFLALCVLQEAGAEPDDGKAGVARVIKNRMAQKYESDGTVVGTVLKYDQFSWAWFAFETVHSGTGTHDVGTQKYVRVASTVEEAMAIAEKKLAVEPADAMSDARLIVSQVQAGNYSGALYNNLTDAALMYLNPRILQSLPPWATQDKFICSIGHHDFYSK